MVYACKLQVCVLAVFFTHTHTMPIIFSKANSGAHIIISYSNHGYWIIIDYHGYWIIIDLPWVLDYHHLPLLLDIPLVHGLSSANTQVRIIIRCSIC